MLSKACCLPLVIVLLLPSGAGSPDAAGSQRLLEDPANDMTLAGAAQAPVPRGSMDLRHLDIEETPDVVRFTVGTQPDTGHSDQAQINVWFRHNDADFRLNLQQRNAVAGWYWLYFLDRVEPGAEMSRVSQSVISQPLAMSRSEGWVQAEIARGDLADRSGALPFAGRALEDVWVESLPYFLDPMVRDRMPESGVAPEGFVFRLGPVQQGDVELWSSSPGRASNGEATTLIYEVTARNVGQDSLSLRFAAHGLAADWQVTFPLPVVELAPGATSSYPVLVQTPFRHDHGQVATVNVTLGNDEGDAGSTTLSVIYHSVPQPAGHHDTVWFHSDRGPDARTPLVHAMGTDVWHGIYMNAVEEFEGDDAVAVPARNRGEYLSWALPLDPVLQMGIDFDLTRTGTVSLPLRAGVEVPNAVVSGDIRLTWQDASGQPQEMVVADIQPSKPQDLSDAPTMVEAVVRATQAGDHVQFREGSNLLLVLELRRDGQWLGTGPETPQLLPGGWMRLPLNEYHDPVDDVFRSLQGVSLESVGAQQRPVNPGETVLFDARLGYAGAASPFALALQGRDAGSARILGPQLVTAGGGQNVSVVVAVKAPPDAVGGTFLDLVLVAQKQDDPDVQGIMRLVADVDTETDHPDQDVQTAQAEASPVPVLAVAAALLLAARRRR